LAATLRPAARAGAAVLALGALAACCGREPTPETLRAQFDEAERLSRSGEYGKAQALLKDYLLYRPDDAGAHYYLGRTYFLYEEFRPVMAEGEYQTALRLFIGQGRRSPIERFEPAYFEMICNVDSAKVLYKQCDAGLALGAPKSALRPIMERALEYIERGRIAMPDAAEVDQIGTFVRQLAREVGVTGA
jgi:tetratricopeptide (TPR) repeat protein